MNFKFINRKQRLGISNPSDFCEWALKLDKEPIERTENAYRLINSVLSDGVGGWTKIPDDYMEWHVHPDFNALVDELGLHFQHFAVENTCFSRAIQSIHTKACNLNLYFNMIDIRLISELGKNQNDIELLDSLMVDCGCEAIGDHWVEYSAEDGKQTLNALFEHEVQPDIDKASTFEKNSLADEYLSYFDDTVRFFGNNGYAPWEEGWRQKPHDTKTKSLQKSYETDFGLVLRDTEHIGFLLLARDHY